MNVVALVGGMGNQMFQYALAVAMNHQGINTAIDDSLLTNHSFLKSEFHLEYKTPELAFFEVLERQSKNRVTIIEQYSDKEQGYDPSVFSRRDCYFVGYWQHERYFADKSVQAQLRQEFATPPQVKNSPSFATQLELILRQPSCAVHVRRGDYLAQGYEFYLDVCTELYYERALAYLQEQVPDAHFFVFSDDKAYVQEKYGQHSNVSVVDASLSATEEFFLMSACDHIILANSTFSWWAAWLNANENAIQLAPERWLNIQNAADTRNYEDIYTARMLKIPAH